MEDISQAKDQLRDEVEGGRSRRSACRPQNRRLESPQIEEEPDQEIEEVLEEIRVIF